MNIKDKYDIGRAIDNIKRIMHQKDIGQKEIEAITGVTQSNISNILNKKKNSSGSYKFFSVEQIIALSEAWGISIDDLLGLQKEAFGQMITPREFCEFITKCKYMNMRMATHSVVEDQFVETWDELGCNIDMQHSKEMETYVAIYFSKWGKIESSDDVERYMQVGNEHYWGKKINCFLERLNQIRKMYLEGSLDEDMYNILLEKYLNDVPNQ